MMNALENVGQCPMEESMRSIMKEMMYAQRSILQGGLMHDAL